MCDASCRDIGFQLDNGWLKEEKENICCVLVTELISQASIVRLNTEAENMLVIDLAKLTFHEPISPLNAEFLKNMLSNDSPDIVFHLLKSGA